MAVVFAASISSLFSSNDSTYKQYLSSTQLFVNTVHELNKVVMGNSFAPMVASRNYTYAAIAAYEVIAAGYPKRYHSLAGQLKFAVCSSEGM